MKKLVLLLLVALGSTLMASADLTRRIYVQQNAGWSNGVGVYAWYNDGSSDVTIAGSWPGAAASSLSDNWYYCDITIPDAANGVINVIFNNNNNGYQTVDIENVDFSSSDYYFKINNETTNSKYTYSKNTLTYSIYKSDGTTTSMSTTDHVTFEGEIDNTAGGSNYYYIAPSFVTDIYSSSNTRWNLLIRPWSNYQTLGFANIGISDEYAGIGIWENNSNAWNTNNIFAKFTLKINLTSWKYSIDAFIPVTFTAGYATFSSAYDVTIPDGVYAYYASGLNANNQVILTKNQTGKIAANDGALLVGTGEKEFTPATDATAYQSDASAIARLVATPTASSVSASAEGSYNYMLANGSKGVGFYNVASGTTSAAGKAYLHTTTALVDESSASRVAWVFEDESTGIAGVKIDAKAEGFYNLNGQRIANPTKGFYISNGKKYIIK